MTLKSIADCERRSLQRMKKYQLPHSFKRIGFLLFAISFIFLFINAFSWDVESYRVAARYGILVGLLVMSISKEPVEDELIIKLRMESYAFAFIMGVVYALVLPFVDYLIDLGLKPDEAAVKDTGDFVILWMLLFVQVFFFEVLKRLYR